MKALVIYDSQFGNTAKVAEAISDGVREGYGGSEVVGLKRIDEVDSQQLAGLDLLIVGSPTQRFQPTPLTTDLLKSIPKEILRNIKAAAFDTRLTEEELRSHGIILSKLLDVFGYAAESIAERLTKRGARLLAPAAGFYVLDTEGPLLDGELERAKEWARGLMRDQGFSERY